MDIAKPNRHRLTKTSFEAVIHMFLLLSEFPLQSIAQLQEKYLIYLKQI